MKRLLFLCLFLTSNFCYSQFNTAKPWAYWWWMGSAVTKEDISENLKSYQKAGFGGMHIIPIYGVKGQEANFISYLSPQWLEMLDYTVLEAKRLGLGIDMSLGTGWPYGGSYVTAEDAAKSFKIITEGEDLSVVIEPTKQKVKRAAPGAEGWVIDHFSKTAVDHYLKPFQTHFSNKNYGVRAFYNDSYEVYGANWTPDFFQKFKTYRQYDLADYLEVLKKNVAETDQEKRIWADYNETLSDILRDDFTKTLTAFSHSYGKIFRNEAHGSPANILDLYAASDVPESEFFGSKPYDIPLVRQDPDYEESRFGRPDKLVLKLASSPAHITGKKLVSSETATWLANHFKVSLSQVKPIVDESFVGGVNHIFFHGVPYSPPKEAWPGWLFYASTNFNQNSHFWETLPELNGYIERCQSILQNAKPDNDVLVYLPFYDLWHSVGDKAKTHPIDVHNLLKGNLMNVSMQNLVKKLETGGFSYDFVSDLQIKNTKLEKSLFKTQGGATYKAIIIPKCHYFSLKTLQTLANFVKNGGKVWFENELPKTVNGFKDFEKRDIEFQKTLLVFKNCTSQDLAQSLANQGIVKEMLVEKGLSFIRKKNDAGTIYFVTNLENKFKVGNIQLASSGNSVRLYDAQHQLKSFISFSKKANNTTEIMLELAPGESVFIEVLKAKNTVDFHSKTYKKQMDLNGNWNVKFTRGEPSLPKPFSLNKLTSWTSWPDSSTQYFSGNANYSIDFKIEDLNFPKDAAIFIDLGDVRETAKVKLNGVDLGTAWCVPFKLKIPQNLLKNNNVLDVEVTNLSVNRMRYLDRNNVQWRKFYDINIVDIRYQPFNASNWPPVDSGLLGPVKIVW